MLEQEFPCDKNNTIYQCSIWTDGFYAVKAKTYDGGEKFEIEDFIFEEIKNGIFDEGNIAIENGIVKQCKKCDKKRKVMAPFLLHKYTVFNKIPNYKKYIKNNKIDNIEEFNKNGYFLAFKNKENEDDNKYLFICKYNNKLESVYNDVWTFLNIYDETFSSEEFDLFYLDVDNFTFETLKSEQTYSCYNIEDDQDTKITLDLKNLAERYDKIEKHQKQEEQYTKCIEKMYSLSNDSRMFNEDIKKIGNNIVIFDNNKKNKIEKMIKKVDYDFLK